VLALSLSARVDDNFELSLVQRHQTEIEARKETGQHQQEDDDDDAQPQRQYLFERLRPTPKLHMVKKIGRKNFVVYLDLEPQLGLVACVHPRAAGVLFDAQVVDGAVLGRRRKTNFDLRGRVHDAIFQHLERGAENLAHIFSIIEGEGE